MTPGTRQEKQIQDPPPGTILSAEPGETWKVVFNFRNEAPLNATFHLEVQGLPGAAWSSGTGTSASTIAPAFGEGALVLAVHPPIQAVGGTHPFRVHIVTDVGEVSGSDSFDLALQIVAPEGGFGESTVAMTRLAEPVIAAAFQGKDEPDEFADTPTVNLPPPVRSSPPPATPTPSPIPPAPVAETPPVRPPAPPIEEEATPTIPIAAKPRPAPAPSAPPPVVTPPVVAPPAAAPVTPPPVAKPAAKPEVVTSRPAVVAPPVVTPPPQPPPARPAPVQPVAAQSAPAQPTPQPPAAPPAPEKPIQVVDFTPPPAATVWGARQTESAHAEEPSEPIEPNLRDPAEGTTVTVEPGGTLLLRFPFTNSTKKEQTYLLEEDRSLPAEWISLTRDQVNLTPNGSGEVMVRVMPPLNAEPGTYPFQVRIGPLGGALQSRNLTLSIPATPAVKLTAKDTFRKVGPFQTDLVKFALSVERAGNADTAFRIIVVPPAAAASAEKPDPARGSTDHTVYENDRWRFQLEREVGNLESPAYGRMPPPQAINLDVVPRGTWWFGFQQSVNVRLQAVPVTDPRNGGKGGNFADLTAVRWRILPFPALLLIPLALLLLPFLFFNANDLRLMNGYASEVGGKYFYVLGGKDEKQLKAQLAWDAPPFVPFTVQSDEKTMGFQFGKASDSFTPASGDYFKERRYSVRGASPIVVRFVPFKTENKLQIRSDKQILRATARDNETFGAAKATAKNAVFNLNVPRSGKPVPISFVNLTSQANAATIKVFLVKEPQSGAYELLDQKNDREATAGGTPTSPIKVKYRAGAEASGDDELIFVTTDGANQIVHIKLKP